MRAALEVEEIAHRLAAGMLLAERQGSPTDMILVGGGPHAATAREGVLKLLETSYARASAFGLEEMLHGPLAAVTPDTLAILIVPSGRTIERAAGLVRALGAIGCGSIAIVGEDSAEAFEDIHRIVLPEVPETIAPIPFIVPIQLLAYFLAVGKGVNPDLLHREDERYRAARSAYR
jgi:glucosamine--fructose-6-phosphate aminotransferase (isomerizing)